MTVTANTTRNDYTAGSAQSEYDYTFQLNEAADVDVYLDGVKQTLNTHYVVQNVGNASGGTIVFTLEDENGDPIHPTQGAIINIVMAMDLDRDTNYQPSGAFLAADVNNDFDRLWLATNQQQTAVNRALRLKDTDVTTSSMELPLKDDRKGKLLAFNATTGDPEATTNNQSNWDTAYNNMITSASFTGGNYILTQQDGGTISTSLDGRYLQLTGGTLTGTLACDNIAISSGSALTFATSAFVISSNGTESIIRETGSGDLSIEGENLYLRSTPTANYLSGTADAEVKLYYNNSEKLATTSTGISVTGNLDFGDNEQATFGDSADLKIYHNGTSSIIQDSGTGDLALLGTNLALADGAGTSYYATGTAGGAFTLYYNGSEKLATTSGGISVTGTLTATGYNDSNWNAAYNDKINSASFDTSNGVLTLTQQDGGTVTVDLDGRYSTDTGIALGDNQKATFGDSDDLQIYHDGSNSYIREDGFGSLRIQGADLELSNPSEIKWLKGYNNNRVELFFNNSKKLATTATGIDVTGTVTADGFSLGNSEYFLAGSGSQLKIGYDGTDNIIRSQGPSLYIDANNHIFRGYSPYTEHMRIDASGKVGIGTSSPSANLHVSSSGDTIARITSADGNGAFLDLGDASDPDGGRIVYDSGSNLALYTASTERLRINSSGKVGIGTTSPSQTLDVAGNIQATGTRSIAALYDSNHYMRLEGNSSGGILKGTDGGVVTTLVRSYGDSYFNGGNLGIGTTSPSSIVHASGVGATFTLQDTRGTGNTHTIRSTGTNGESLQIDSAQDIYINADKQIFRSASEVERMRITSSGNVGIGTSSPSRKLTVQGGSGDNLPVRVVGGSGTTKSHMEFQDASTTADYKVTLGSVGDGMSFQAGGSERMRIDSSGNVGIGTTSPSYKGHLEYTKTSDGTIGLRVEASATAYDGKVISWGEGTVENGVLGWADGFGLDSCYIASGIAGLRFQREFGSSPRIAPCNNSGVLSDDAIDLGASNARFDDIYATNTSIISSSDSTLKQDIEELTDAEERVAIACKGLLRKFRWISSVEEKGDDARIHFGIMAQDLRDAFTAEGLDAGRYGMFISNTWWEHEGEHYPTAESAPEGATEVTRLGVRYSELLAFIISAI